MEESLIDQMHRQEKYYWWHRAKRRLVHKFLNQLRKPREKIRILDVGCGTGLLLDELKESGEVWGIDRSEKALSFCRKRGILNVKRASLGKEKLPFADNSFDFVLLLDVLEHIAGEEFALEEVRRVAKKGGYILAACPAYSWLFSYWDKLLGHKRRYSSLTLKRLFESLNFQTIKISYLYSFLLPIAVLLRIIKKILKKEKESDFIEMPGFFHFLLYLLSDLELRFLKISSLPFGLSIFGVFRKND